MSKWQIKQRWREFWLNTRTLGGDIKTFYQAVFKESAEGLHSVDDGLDQAVDLNLKNDVSISRSIRIIITIFSLVLVFVIWANLFSIDEVSKGDGKVVRVKASQRNLSCVGHRTTVLATVQLIRKVLVIGSVSHTVTLCGIYCGQSIVAVSASR